MLDGRVDLAVHSLKDLPTVETPGLCLAAVPQRAPPADVLVSARYASIDKLPAGATVGTSSVRRRSQLLHFRRDLQVQDIRGNLDTRLRKLDEGNFDAIILAEAGLRRLGLAKHIAQRLPLQLMLPAIGQGALGLEIRLDDQAARRMIAPLDHSATHAAILAERAMLAALQGGCMAPVAGLARLENQQLMLTGRVLSRDGDHLLEHAQDGPADEPLALGGKVAAALLAEGAAELVRQSRDSRQY